MASINMNDQQSFLLNDIKTEIRCGRNVTHILNVKISKEGDNNRGTSIRHDILQKIKNIPHHIDVDGLPVTITWKTSADYSSAYYFSNNPLISDIAVKKHTKILLSNILDQLDANYGHPFSQGTTGIAFIVTKPLSKNVALGDDSDKSD